MGDKMDWNENKNTSTKPVIEIKTQEEILNQLKQIEWDCEIHGFDKIWIGEGKAICLQCACETLGVEVVSYGLKRIQHIS